MNSIVKNCSDCDRLSFYILVETQHLENLTEIACAKFFKGIQVNVKAITQEDIDKVISYKEYCKDNIHCKNVMNFSRFLLPEIFPSLRYFIYIDTDYLVLDDICKLWSCLDFTNDFYAVPSEFENKTIYALSRDAEQTLQLSSRIPFNAGIQIIDGEKWRAKETAKEMISFMNDPLLQKAFRFGTQPLLNYKFQETYTYLPTCWNRIAYDDSKELKVRNIDMINNLTEAELLREGYSAIHFAGCPKPWVNIHSVGGGNWPSPGPIYSRYYPYKQVLKFHTSLKQYLNTQAMKLFIEKASDYYGIRVLFVKDEMDETKTNSEQLQSYFTETDVETSSTFCFVLIKESIVFKTMSIDNSVLYDMAAVNNRKDGFYLIDQQPNGVKLVYKNLFEPNPDYKALLNTIIPFLILLRFIK